MKDKVVLVTGAGRGIGRAIATHCAAAGAVAVVNDINPDTAEATVKAITESGGRAVASIADVAQKMAVQTMHYEILDKFGRVDVLVNNARIEPGGSVLTLDEWNWDRVFGVNLKGPFLCMQTVARGMKEQGGGVIINLLGPQLMDGRHVAYIASQVGLASLTIECARELVAYNIHACAVQPTSPEETVAQVLQLITDH